MNIFWVLGIINVWKATWSCSLDVADFRVQCMKPYDSLVLILKSNPQSKGSLILFSTPSTNGILINSRVVIATDFFVHRRQTQTLALGQLSGSVVQGSPAGAVTEGPELAKIMWTLTSSTKVACSVSGAVCAPEGSVAQTFCIISGNDEFITHWAQWYLCFWEGDGFVERVFFLIQL